MRKIMKMVVFSVAVLAVAACGNPKDANKANFSKAIQAYLDTQPGVCLRVPTFPYVQHKEVFPSLIPNLPQKLNAFVDAGFLSTRDFEVKERWGNKMLPATEYQVTELGKQYRYEKMSSGFCTGKRKLTSIGNFTEPAPMPFANVTASEVEFHYEITDLAEWVNSEKVRAAYDGEEFKELEENRDSATLILTNEGWMHARLFNEH
jgi:hypothetical protein